MLQLNPLALSCCLNSTPAVFKGCTHYQKKNVCRKIRTSVFLDGKFKGNILNNFLSCVCSIFSEDEGVWLLLNRNVTCPGFTYCLNLCPQTRAGSLPSERPGGFCRVLLRPNPKPSLWTGQKSLPPSSSPSSSKNWLPSPRSTPSCPTFQWRSDWGLWWLLHRSVYLDKPQENFQIHKKIFYYCYRVFIFCFPAKIIDFKAFFCQSFSFSLDNSKMLPFSHCSPVQQENRLQVHRPKTAKWWF